jgi:hypothetical protein
VGPEDRGRMTGDEDPVYDPQADPFRPRPKRPWFGRKPNGYGYGPRTWQGWLVMLVLIIYAMIMAAASKGDGKVIALGIVPVVAVPFIIMGFQSRS